MVAENNKRKNNNNNKIDRKFDATAARWNVSSRMARKQKENGWFHETLRRRPPNTESMEFKELSVLEPVYTTRTNKRTYVRTYVPTQISPDSVEFSLYSSSRKRTIGSRIGARFRVRLTGKRPTNSGIKCAFTFDRYAKRPNPEPRTLYMKNESIQRTLPNDFPR